MNSLELRKMEDDDERAFIRSKNNVISSKNVKYLTKYQGTNDAFRKDFGNIELELENENLRKMISLLEGKNNVLKEHCNLLQEKNNYFQSKLSDMQLKEKDDVSDKDSAEKDTDETTNDEDKKMTSLTDRLKGVVFGVALPKLGQVFSKIKEKKDAIKGFVEEHGPGGDHDGNFQCPMQKMNFKARVAALKVNLFRVVVVLGSLMVLSGVGYAGYTVWKTRYRHPSYLEQLEDEDDSAEELFTAPGGSRGVDNIGKSNSTDSFEAPGISTDFKSILDTANNK